MAFGYRVPQGAATNAVELALRRITSRTSALLESRCRCRSCRMRSADRAELALTIVGPILMVQLITGKGDGMYLIEYLCRYWR